MHIASSVWFLAWCVNVGLIVFSDFVYPFTNIFLCFDFQKFVDFVASSFMSPQNHIDHGNQLKGPPCPTLINSPDSMY